MEVHTLMPALILTEPLPVMRVVGALVREDEFSSTAPVEDVDRRPCDRLALFAVTGRRKQPFSALIGAATTFVQ